MDVNDKSHQLSEEEAYQHQIKVIEEWTPKSGTLFLRYGTIGLAALAAACGMVVTSHYRSVLKLRSYGLVSSHLPVMAIPAASVGVTHQLVSLAAPGRALVDAGSPGEFVTRDLLVFETTCPVCVNMRAVAIQLGFSLGLPVAMATISNFHLAERRMTYALPALVEDPRAWLAVWRRLSRPLARPLGIMAALNAVCAAFVMHMEASEFYTILEKVDQERRWRELKDG